MSVNGAFWRNLEQHGAAPALLSGSSNPLSYADLAARADAWGARYAALLPSTRPLLIALQIAPDADAIAAYLGALRAGHAVILCDCAAMEPDHPIRRIYRPNLLVRMQHGKVEVEPGDPEPAAMHPNLAVLLSTSGTTGAPKLVRLSADNIAANAASIAEYLELGPSERAITTLPLHYSYGMSVLHAHLAAGGSLVLCDLSIVTPAFWDLFRDTGATSLAFVPHQFDLLDTMQFEHMDLPNLRYITQAGGKLARSKVRHFHDIGQAAGWNLFIMYGQTEAAPRMSYIPPEELGGHMDTIGKPIPGGRLWVRDEDGAEIGVPNRPGELIYEGPNVMLGYAESRTDLASPAGPALLETGDIAELSEAGYFRIVGRKKRFVKLYGLRLSLDQIDLNLSEAGLAGFALNVNDRLIVLHEDPTAGPAIATHLTRAYDLPGEALLTAPIERVPLLSSGKVDYRGLQALAEAARDAEAATPAAKGASIREVIARATRSATVSGDDTFSALGGDSLGYLQVSLALEEQLGHVPDGWENMTIATLETTPHDAAATGSLDADVVTRLAAVSLIVLRHTTGWPIGGGTWVLLTIIGYSLARFGFGALNAGRPGKLFLQMIYPIIPLYYLILLAFMTVGMHPPLGMLTLTDNLGIPGWDIGEGLVTPNWFVSLYVQLLILVIGILALPPVLARLRRDPWTPALAALGVSLLMSLAWQHYGAAEIAPGVPRHDWISIIRVPMTCLPFVILGWLIFTAKSARQRWLSLVAVLATVAVFPAPSIDYKIVILLLSLYLLADLRIPVPRALSKALRILAGTTLFVFLLHGIPVHLVRYRSDLLETIGPLASGVLVVVVSFAMALVAKWAFDALDSTVLRMMHRRQARMAEDRP